MMVLIMTNINHLVILICSIVFLLSSFVSSQQKPRNYEDPVEFYNYALYLRNYYPEYYAKNYPHFHEIYSKLISDAEAKPNPSNKRTSKNNGQMKRNGASNSAGSSTAMQVDDLSRSPHRKPLVNNVSPLRPKSEETTSRVFSSRSLNSPVSSGSAAFEKTRREMAIEMELEWAHHCFNSGYNNTNDVCQSDSHEIKGAPNETICRDYFKFGCQYRLNRDLCGAATDEVMRNTSFDCGGINKNGDTDFMSLQCCMACKSGINTATSKDKCDMHLDNSWPSFAQDKCCKTFLNSTVSVPTTESIPTSVSMDKIIDDLDERLPNSTTFNHNNSSVSTTESTKPGSMDAIIAHLEERFSNSTTHKLDIVSSTVPETSPLPTTTTTATPTTATPTTTAATTTAATTTAASTTAASTTAASTTAATTTAATTTTTTTELTTTTEPTTATPTPTTPTTTSPSPSELQTTTERSLSTITDETHLASRSLDEPNEVLSGYKLLDLKRNIYEKINNTDKSKPDFLVILQDKRKIWHNGFYNGDVLMDISFGPDIECAWNFKIEKVDAADHVKPLTIDNFEQKKEKYRFILYVKGEVQPQTIQCSLTCDIKSYKYYKHVVYVTFSK